MRFRILLLIFVILIAVSAFRRSNTTLAAHKPPARVPVIVELFTSEGCSSCPPADELLSKLQVEQPVPNAEIVVLGEHVDYWNYIGWTDRFSSKQFTDRQQRYAEAFNLDSAYTPQMVVDGAAQVNGADEPAIAKAVAVAALEPHVKVELKCLHVSNGSIQFEVRVPKVSHEGGDVFLAITELDLTTQITRGENAGRTLRHTGVVRYLSKIGSVTKDGFFAQSAVIMGFEWKLQNMDAVAFIQKRGTKRILGSGFMTFRD